MYAQQGLHSSGTSQLWVLLLDISKQPGYTSGTGLSDQHSYLNVSTSVLDFFPSSLWDSSVSIWVNQKESTDVVHPCNGRRGESRAPGRHQVSLSLFALFCFQGCVVCFLGSFSPFLVWQFILYFPFRVLGLAWQILANWCSLPSCLHVLSCVVVHSFLE